MEPEIKKIKEKQLNSTCQQHVSDHPCKKSKRELRWPYGSPPQNSFQKPDISEVNELYGTDDEVLLCKILSILIYRIIFL